MSDLDTETLFTAAVDVWNRALKEHRDEFPFRDLLPKCESALRDRDMEVHVYEHDPEAPIARFAVRLADGSIQPAALGEEPWEPDWKFSRGELRDVVDGAERYVSQPEKLNWDWLSRQVGASV